MKTSEKYFGLAIGP